MRSGPGAARTILLFHTISARAPKQPRMVRTFLKVHARPRLAYALRLSHSSTRSLLGATFANLSPHELAWCCVIVELPHHKGGLGITPLPAGMAAFYSATAHLVSWLASLPHASEWGACQNLADPTSWNTSAIQTLKQLHGNLLTHYNCTEWAHSG